MRHMSCVILLTSNFIRSQWNLIINIIFSSRLVVTMVVFKDLIMTHPNSYSNLTQMPQIPYNVPLLLLIPLHLILHIPHLTHTSENSYFDPILLLVLHTSQLTLVPESFPLPIPILLILPSLTHFNIV